MDHLNYLLRNRFEHWADGKTVEKDKGEIEFKCRKMPNSNIKQRAKQLRRIWDGDQVSMFETDLNIE
jgi:hypothetical protein